MHLEVVWNIYFLYSTSSINYLSNKSVRALFFCFHYHEIIKNTCVFGRKMKSDNRSGLGLIPLIPDFINQADRQYIISRIYFQKPSVIGHYRKPINQPLMIPYTEKEVGLGYIGGKTITVGSWVSPREFLLPTQLAIKVTDINWH